MNCNKKHSLGKSDMIDENFKLTHKKLVAKLKEYKIDLYKYDIDKIVKMAIKKGIFY